MADQVFDGCFSTCFVHDIIHRTGTCYKVNKILKNCFQIQDTALEQANDIFSSNIDGEIVSAMKSSGVAGDLDKIDELTVQIFEHSEQVQEVGVFPGLLFSVCTS